MDPHPSPRRAPVFVPLAGPPAVPPPSRAIFAAMGEANIERMLESFYMELGRSDIRHLFPGDLVDASRRSAAFFVGLLGGPPRYQERYGHPALRARHLPFHIDEAARQAWLRCFDKILDQAPESYSFPIEHIEGFRHWLREFSRWMVNAR